MNVLNRFRHLSTETCRLCGAVRSGDHIVAGVCDACRRELASVPGPFVVTPDRDDPDPWVVCAGEYGGILLRLIERVKLAGDASLLAVAVETLLGPTLDRLVTTRADTAGVRLVPIPAGRRGRRRRGFDQSRLLAEALAVRSAQVVRVHPVLSRRRGVDQKHLHRSDRLTNMERQMQLRRGAALPASDLVVVVDDVVTTGASMQAARRLLEASGASRCIGLAIAFRA